MLEPVSSVCIESLHPKISRWSRRLAKVLRALVAVHLLLLLPLLQRLVFGSTHKRLCCCWQCNVSGAAGEVFLAQWNGQSVAVKVSGQDHVSFNLEEFLFEVCLLGVSKSNLQRIRPANTYAYYCCIALTDRFNVCNST
jgi:hypothetical protein